MSELPCTIDGIRSASRRVGLWVSRTPVIGLRMPNGRLLHLKCEHRQIGRAFKIRGAMNAVWSLTAKDAAMGVVTHSSGNHAQALARAAHSRGIECTVVMPTSAPEIKREATLAQGATIVDCEPTLAAREAAASEVVASTGALLIPPYDHRSIIAGQGTVGLELAEQMPSLDAVIVPVGGGGLVSGVAIALRALVPGVRIIAAEPAGADDAYRSFQSGKLVVQANPNTIADGLHTSLGRWTWPVIRDLVDEIVLVEDAEIIQAMRWLGDELGDQVEPSGAVSVAAAMQSNFAEGRGLHTVVAVISGGNISDAQFAQLTKR